MSTVSAMEKSFYDVFIVDDDAPLLDALSRALKSLPSNVTCFENAAECIKRLRTHNCDLLITDVRMPKTDGFELLSTVNRITPYVPVLFITAYADIPSAVRAVKNGAFDFVEKPFKKEVLLQKARSALANSDSVDPLVKKMLTGIEMRVLRLLCSGKSNKETAWIMHRSVRTIEEHRSRIMRKLDVDNFAELVKVGIERLASKRV